MSKSPIKFEDTNPDHLRTAAHDNIVTAFAAVSQMDSMVWQVRSDLDAWEDEGLQDLALEINKRLRDLGALYIERFRDRCFIVKFRGELTGHTDLSHYDIEEAMRQRWSNKEISCDSESGGFYVDTTEAVRDEVDAFLKSVYPDLRYDTEVEDDAHDEYTTIRPNSVGSWTNSEKWLADRELTIDFEVPAIAPKPGPEMKELLDQARNALLKTGLPFDEALSLLATTTEAA